MPLPKQRVRVVGGPSAIFGQAFGTTQVLFYNVAAGVRTLGQPKIRMDMIWDDDSNVGNAWCHFAWGLYLAGSAIGDPSAPNIGGVDWLLWGTGLLVNSYSYQPGGVAPQNETPFRWPSLTIEDESQAMRQVDTSQSLFLAWQATDWSPGDTLDGILWCSLNMLVYGDAV